MQNEVIHELTGSETEEPHVGFEIDFSKLPQSEQSMSGAQDIIVIDGVTFTAIPSAIIYHGGGSQSGSIEVSTNNGLAVAWDPNTNKIYTATDTSILGTVDSSRIGLTSPQVLPYQETLNSLVSKSNALDSPTFNGVSIQPTSLIGKSILDRLSANKFSNLDTLGEAIYGAQELLDTIGAAIKAVEDKAVELARLCGDDSTPDVIFELNFGRRAFDEFLNSLAKCTQRSQVDDEETRFLRKLDALTAAIIEINDLSSYFNEYGIDVYVSGGNTRKEIVMKDLGYTLANISIPNEKTDLESSILSITSALISLRKAKVAVHKVEQSAAILGEKSPPFVGGLTLKVLRAFTEAICSSTTLNDIASNEFSYVTTINSEINKYVDLQNKYRRIVYEINTLRRIAGKQKDIADRIPDEGNIRKNLSALASQHFNTGYTASPEYVKAVEELLNRISTQVHDLQRKTSGNWTGGQK